MQKTVNTVRGPISTENLGMTLMHEHLFTPYPELREQYPWDEDAVVAGTVAKMKAIRERGIKTLVDMTVYGLGRNVSRVLRVAEESDLHIIVATGIYTFFELPEFFKLGQILDSPTFIADFLTKEVEEGIGNTGIKPAILKCATDRHGVTKDVDTTLRAIAQVHRNTGLIIATHTHAKSKQGLAQQKIFREVGVDLTRVIIGHVGDSNDLDYMEELLSNGSIIGMDRFGMNNFNSLENRLASVVEMCKRGYARQMVISLDLDSYSDAVNEERLKKIPGFEESRRYTYLSDIVIPALLEEGVSQVDIDTMLIENPRRIFESVGAY
jgi:phosphotriesterase-related protein